MLLFGKEEPLSGNEQIYELDEKSDKIVLSCSVDNCLNRYSLVCIGEIQECKSDFHSALAVIQEEIKVSGNWILAWTNENYASSIKSKWLRSKRNKEGWDITQHDATTVGIRSSAHFGYSAFGPPQYGWENNSALFLLFNKSHNLIESLLETPVRTCLDFAARSGKLVPSKQFISWLSKNQSSIVYGAKDSLGHPALIIITPTALKLKEMQKKGTIGKTFAESNADLVWLHYQ